MNIRLVCLLLLSSLVASCSSEAWQRSFSRQQMRLAYDDFGPESICARLIGPRGDNTRIMVHHSSTRLTPEGPEDVRYLNISQAMDFLRYEVKHLPRTPENEVVRQRLRTTYSPIYDLYRLRRDAIMSRPFPHSRGSLNRAFILPPRPPRI